MDHNLMATEPGKRLSEEFLIGVFEKRIARIRQKLLNEPREEYSYAEYELWNIATDDLGLKLNEDRIIKLMAAKGVEEWQQKSS